MYDRNPTSVVVSTIHLPPEVHGTLKNTCRNNGWSIRWFTIQAIKEKLARMSAAGV